MSQSARQFTVLMAAAFLSTSLFAACGGGGWKKKDDSRLSAKEQPVLVQDVGVSLDSQSFDAISGKLRLDLKQADAIIDVMRSIRATISAKKAAIEDLREKYRHCTGKCEEELARINAAIEDLKHYEPNREFDTKVSSILDSEQVKTYQQLRHQTAQKS